MKFYSHYLKTPHRCRRSCPAIGSAEAEKELHEKYERTVDIMRRYSANSDVYRMCATELNRLEIHIGMNA